MAKRPAELGESDGAKKARAELGDDPLEVRRELFKAGGLRAPDYKGTATWTLVAPGCGAFATAKPLELQYFAIRALGQLPQLCLEAAGYPYRYKVMLSPYFRDNVKSTLAYGRLPCVRTLGGKEIVQSKAVLRYVAKVCGLAGDNDDEVAVCDMVHEMLLAEAKLDDLEKLAGSGKKKADAIDVKGVSRAAEAELDEAQRCLNALGLWEGTLARAQAAGGEWLLAGLEDGKMTKLCYVDLVLFWKLRTQVPLLEELGFTLLVEYVKKVGAQEGVVRLFQSGRLMPNMATGYLYVEDDLVKKP